MMLASFRRFANTWPARIFLILLGISFGLWGIADVARRILGGSDAVATVRGHEITPEDFQRAYQQNMQQYAAQFPDPSQVPAALRTQIARQTLQQLVTQAALSWQEDRMGVSVPDDQVRATVFAMPGFQGLNGKFDRQMLLAALSTHHMTEATFLDLVRGDIRQDQLIQAIAASARPSDLLTRRVYLYLKQTRRADVLFLPFAGQPLPAAPDEAVLKRYYTNNPGDFTAPEYRHVSVVVLSPATIGRDLPISDAAMQAWYKAHRSEFVAPEKRAAQVITTATLSAAQSLASVWRDGATWDAMQSAAKPLGATTVTLDATARADMPSPELAVAVFDAKPDVVVGPVKQALGYYIVRVTGVTPPRDPSFDDLKATIHARIADAQALDLIDARAQKLQDLFAGGAKITEVPGDLGASGAQGTMDAQGVTPAGEAAPLPGDAALRKLIIAAAFAAKPGDQIEPVEGPDHAWYAVSVDQITKPALKPFDQVAPLVLHDWQRDQMVHAQNASAAHFLSLVKAGQSLANAAWGSGLQVTHTPPLTRGRPQAGLSAELVQTLFTLNKGQATETQTPQGFIVAQVTDIMAPDIKDDPGVLKQTRDGLTQALRDDYLQIYALALRDQAKPVIHPGVVEQLISQHGEEGQ